MRHNKTVLHIEDMGAGSRTAATKQRTVAQLAASAVKPPKYGRMLHRLVRYFQPQTMVELGTSLGVTSAYLTKGNPEGTLYTIEGSSAVHTVAKENFRQLQLQNVRAMEGNFDLVLPKLLPALNSVDLAYFDGNHRYAPTMNYFHQMLPLANAESVFVFDDIHWSAEMEQAWEEIKAHPAVRCTVDIFFLGFVFFREGFHEKQHFTIRF